MRDYEAALAAPTSRGGRGWKHAEDDSVLAAAAQALQYRHPGISPKLVYEGAVKAGLTGLELLRLGDDWRKLDDLMWS
jgi:hypothetical protein